MWSLCLLITNLLQPEKTHKQLPVHAVIMIITIIIIIIIIIMSLTSVGRGHYKMMADVCLSVYLSRASTKLENGKA